MTNAFDKVVVCERMTLNLERSSGQEGMYAGCIGLPAIMPMSPWIESIIWWVLNLRDSSCDTGKTGVGSFCSSGGTGAFCMGFIVEVDKVGVLAPKSMVAV